MTFEQLAAGIGGTVGLCMGASFLSIFEIFELVYRIIYLRVKGTEPALDDNQVNHIISLFLFTF